MPGVKARLVNLIGAVRTLMRSKQKPLVLARVGPLTMLRSLAVPLIGINILVIMYELLLG